MLSVVDLFCGAGGLSLGFQNAGFRVLLGNDIEGQFGETFSATHSGAKFLEGPVSELRGRRVLRETGLSRGELNVLVGGPPCQGYSVYNHGRGSHDPRASLFRDYLAIVEGVLPEWLVMENVVGLLSIDKGALFETIKAEIIELGYTKVQALILKAEEYGVPQERRRVVFVANRLGIPISPPEKTHSKEAGFVSVWDAIGDLPPIYGGVRDPRAVPYAAEPSNPFQHRVRGNRTVVSDHIAPRLGPANQERVKHIPEGGSWRDIPVDLLPAGMRKAKRSDHTKRYGRPRKSDLACTILTKCDIHWGAFLHPIQNRPFSVREAARLQSFPDSFEFKGSMTEKFVQVGNAVPPMLAEALANSIIKCRQENVRKAA
ncbi:DNA (cytosine-5-)-methyltransferase [Pacificimonas flava]|uniref:Cytosine-specific methyltransferase n=2 Tax=Pacificimonas TaxID=1960290 RepID=A0A219B7C4_9SPHN|nr:MULTISPECIES: DNA cytosine methyltransferase [Pacificimonas]MBZ6378417.1 DNA cytosine methyltransferase [Pacificimonas aurantium]OWV34280.1 DNA (cytosine-5-)-methyltransferase [Pacificimonas flava]